VIILSKYFDIDNHQYPCHIDGDRYHGGCAERRSEERDTNVYNLNGIAWMIRRLDPAEDRNRAHLLALREAKVAIDVRELPVNARRMSLGQLALAGVGGGTASLDAGTSCA
jgi:hypothetical protein